MTFTCAACGYASPDEFTAEVINDQTGKCPDCGTDARAEDFTFPIPTDETGYTCEVCGTGITHDLDEPCDDCARRFAQMAAHNDQGGK